MDADFWTTALVLMGAAVGGALGGLVFTWLIDCEPARGRRNGRH